MNRHGIRPYRRAGRHPGRDSAELIVLHARCACYLAIASSAAWAGAGQVRGAYWIESNGQSRSTHARTASCRTGSSAA
jgi:hypothetical protein